MANGKIAQVIGTVVDVKVPADEPPALSNAVELPTNDPLFTLEG